VPHLPRAVLASRFPVHATWRMAEGVWNLRSRRSFRALAPALWAGAERAGFRLVHYAIMGNHLHLLVEATDRRALMRGMQGLGVRVARRLNRMMRRSGRVVGDRYHARILRTPTEVRRARTYLLTNAAHHYGASGPDHFVSRAPLALPHTWLLRRHC
jgi:REP element-mobilizing transposase RayT